MALRWWSRWLAAVAGQRVLVGLAVQATVAVESAKGYVLKRYYPS